MKWGAVFSFQAGEFFYSAQNTAVAWQREVEAHHIGEGSIDSPLLLEQVLFCSLIFHFLSLSLLA